MTETSEGPRAGARVAVRAMTEADLPAADAVLRAAFSTFTGIPDMFGDADYAYARFRAAPDAAFTAELDGEVVGSSFVTRWGSFGFFGPLSVRPDLWDQGVARRLLGPTVDLFDAWGVTDSGLFTFPASTKHVALYRAFGFWPQSLTFIAAAPVPGDVPGAAYDGASDVAGAADACAALTGGILDGLDVRREIEAVAAQGLGETLLVGGGDLAGFAVCHTGAGSEAGSGTCYVKFAAARDAAAFGRVVDAVVAYAASAGAGVVTAGCNAARQAACEVLFGRGFVPQAQGVAMQRGNRPGFNRPDAFVADDWR